MSNNYKLDKIKNAKTLSEQKNRTKDLLTTTDFIFQKDVLTFFDDEKSSKEENYLKKFLEYKNTKSRYGYADCDVSLPCTTMYALLNNKLDTSNIINQFGSKIKYQIINNSQCFRGDTLTSALHPLKLYLGFYWERINSDTKLQKKYADFYRLFKNVSQDHIPVVEEGKWNNYCYENSDTIWNAMDEPAKEFFRCYTKFGNYMCIPADHTKRAPSFNQARSKRGKWDTVDTLLIKLYAYFKYNDIQYLKNIFTSNKEELAKETEVWLNSFKDWNDFLNQNCLHAFVDSNTLIPISMKTGKTIGDSEIINYSAMPTNYDECLIFFEQLSNRIKSRTQSIYEKLNN